MQRAPLNFFTAENKTKEIWTEDPQIAYRHYLQYAGETIRTSVEYNVEDNKDTSVSDRKGEFYPLNRSIGDFYCSKLTIRNIENAELFFEFGQMLPRSIDLFSDFEVKNHLVIANRSIVPGYFAKTRSLAGPMAYHEYLIDGNQYPKKTFLSFKINSNFKMTPIKIVLENCKGACFIKGINKKNVELIFVNKSDMKNFTMSITDKPCEAISAEEANRMMHKR